MMIFPQDVTVIESSQLCRRITILSTRETITRLVSRCEENMLARRRPFQANPSIIEPSTRNARSMATQVFINGYDLRWSCYAVSATVFGYDLEHLEEPVMPPARAAVQAFRSQSARVQKRVGPR
jgi:hypothetical protein